MTEAAQLKVATFNKMERMEEHYDRLGAHQSSQYFKNDPRWRCGQELGSSATVLRVNHLKEPQSSTQKQK
jgi:hypothetical protein